MERWYHLTDRNEVVGPVSGNALRSLFTSGEITSASSVCREGTEEWVSATESLSRFAEPPTPTASVDDLIAKIPKPNKRDDPARGCQYGCLTVMFLALAFVVFAIYVSSTTDFSSPSAPVPSSAAEHLGTLDGAAAGRADARQRNTKMGYGTRQTEGYRHSAPLAPTGLPRSEYQKGWSEGYSSGYDSYSK